MITINGSGPREIAARREIWLFGHVLLNKVLQFDQSVSICDTGFHGRFPIASDDIHFCKNERLFDSSVRENDNTINKSMAAWPTENKDALIFRFEKCQQSIIVLIV